MSAGEDAYLEGVRVLDFTQYLAGPACTRLLTELGAEVIKVEIPPYGDPTRAQTPRVNRRSGYTVQQNRGKRSLSIDVRTPEGIEVIKDLIPKIDVVVENYSPGVMDRRGLGYEDLAAINPRIIVASISGFGHGNSLSHKTAFDFIAQAYGGLMHMTGEPDGPPFFVGAGIVDVGSGVHAFAGIGYALYRRDRTGKGCHIDVGMVDSVFHMQEMAAWASSLPDSGYVPMRTGRHYGPVSPAGAFASPGGWIVVFCTHAQMPQLWEAMGRHDLADDPRFVHPDARIEHRDALTEIIEAWMATFATDDDVLAALEAQRIPCGPVLSPADAINHPWFIERGTVREVHDERLGTLKIPGFPIRFSDAPPPLDLVAAELGQDNRAVLSELAGYDSATLDALEASGVLFTKDN